MNRHEVYGSWKVLKGRVRQHWGQATGREFPVIQGAFGELAGKIQRAYGRLRKRWGRH